MSIVVKIGFLAFYLVLSACVTAQPVNLGNPPVRSFSKKDYTGGTQTWDICQDSRGILWFANNAGVLEFDGTHWRQHAIPNRTIVRSVEASPDGRIYVGAQDDFGYLAPDVQGRMFFHSLKGLLPKEEQGFGDVWHIAVRPEGVFFRTNYQVFHFTQNKLKVLFPGGLNLSFMGTWKHHLLIQDTRHRFYIYDAGRIKPLPGVSDFNQGIVSGIFSIHPDTILVTTIKDGIFFEDKGEFKPWKTQDDALLKANIIYCSGILPNGNIVLGSSLNGLIILDKYRRVYTHLNKKSGLQNNTILSLLTNSKGQVWLGLDNGIDFVDLHAPFSVIYPDGELEGAGYAVGIQNGQIYFGMNTGLYAAPWKKFYDRTDIQAFKLIQGSEGQVWSLNALDGQLLMGHHEGPFRIESARAQALAPIPGVWKFIPISTRLAISGHYNGISIFEKKGSNWSYKALVVGLAESSRMIALDKYGTVWMAHPYRGIYRIQVDTISNRLTYDFLGAREGLPSNIGNHLFQLGEKIVFTGEHGVFEYDESQKRFRQNKEFARYFDPQTHFQYLMQDGSGNIWYSTDTETGLLYVENTALEKRVSRIPIPELKDQLSSAFPFILPVDRENVFIPTGQGIIHFNPAVYLKKDSVMRLIIQEVRLEGKTDSVLFGGFARGDTKPGAVLSNLQNTLRFTFSAPDYPASPYVRYAHRLEGLESTWSPWETAGELTYNHLPPGNYRFMVKAISPKGTESTIQTFEFTIIPPWYARKLAYALYGLILLGCVLTIIARVKKRYEREKQDLQHIHALREAQHELETRKSQEEISRLRQEKLEAEIRHQSQELASATMHLVQKSEILNAVQEELTRLSIPASTSGELQKEVARIAKMLERDAHFDDDWEHFAQHFDQVHSDFLKRISAQFPDLSRNDFKLCAYLRMNLSSKEIASLMNISLRGVEASRYRLRKRLQLNTDTNLTEFLMRF